MKTIYKYKLEVIGQQSIVMPLGAETLSIQAQHGEPCLWALVDPDNAPTERSFLIYGTGHIVDHENLLYIDTFQMIGGDLIWHVFEQL